jgi:hypothetical protein
VRSIGLCTPKRRVEQLGYEMRHLYQAAQRHYERVLLIDTRAVSYQFIRGERLPRMAHNGEEISGLNSLQVTGTKGRSASTGLLVRALRVCGCDIFDPVGRFSVGFASKLLTTLDRFVAGVGSHSFVAFQYGNTSRLIDAIDERGFFPVLAKPITGRQGRGIRLLNTPSAAKKYAEAFFAARPDEDYPILLQRYEQFVAEYRVLLVDGRALGVVQKVKKPGQIAANAAQGGTFVAVNAPRIGDFAARYVSRHGVLGVDVALDASGNLHLIEANRAPLWQAFEHATGIDVAEWIMRRSVTRVERGYGRGNGDKP